MSSNINTCENCTFFYLKRFDELVEKEGLQELKAKKCGSCNDGIWEQYRKGVERFSIGRARYFAKLKKIKNIES